MCVHAGRPRAVRQRLLAGLVPTVARAAFPYLKSPPAVDVGHGLAVHNPLPIPSGSSKARAARRARMRARPAQPSGLPSSSGCRTSLIRERVITAYQPILR